MADDGAQAEIRSLHGYMPPNSGQVVPSVVEYLKGLVDRAERGEIIGIGTAVVNGAGVPETGWADGHAEWLAMVASISYQHHRIIAHRAFG